METGIATVYRIWNPATRRYLWTEEGKTIWHSEEYAIRAINYHTEPGRQWGKLWGVGLKIVAFDLVPCDPAGKGAE
jgi:hypothetical protein